MKTKTVSTTKLPGIDPEESTSETPQTLVALDSENATLKTQVKQSGVEVPATEMKFPLRAQTPTDPAAVKTAEGVKTREMGTEKLTIGGKTLTCKPLAWNGPVGSSRRRCAAMVLVVQVAGFNIDVVAIRHHFTWGEDFLQRCQGAKAAFPA